MKEATPLCQAWWLMAVVLVLGRRRQEDQSWLHSEFEASLGCVKPNFKTK